jgi:hypothetical protein
VGWNEQNRLLKSTETWHLTKHKQQATHLYTYNHHPDDNSIFQPNNNNKNLVYTKHIHIHEIILILEKQNKPKNSRKIKFSYFNPKRKNKTQFSRSWQKTVQRAGGVCSAIKITIRKKLRFFQKSKTNKQNCVLLSIFGGNRCQVCEKSCRTFCFAPLQMVKPEKLRSQKCEKNITIPKINFPLTSFTNPIN